MEEEVHPLSMAVRDHGFEATIDAALATMPRVCDPTRTLVPATRRVSDVLELLGRPLDRYRIGHTLGEGGMGIVHLAEQRALGRQVAIKTLKADVANHAAVTQLLQEAWVTGSLEHPNVVPVYDIDRDPEGRPRIVLKKIEGQQWAHLMHDPDAILRLHHAADPLEWNLSIVIEVCRALRFAHARGFVHRDIKPENVMVGPFGEVYVLDWGIAVATHDDGTGRFPLASDATQMAGTPCYMAPEQLGGEHPHIGPWTDVYLVGAMLFELIAGRPPHEDSDLRAILASVLRSTPEVPPSTPPELADIVRRAMAPAPADRFASVEALQLALEGFLRHRGSRHLTVRADEAARAMMRAIDDNDEVSVEAHFAECAFGYRAALEAWPENEAARTQLRRATIVRIDYELERGEPSIAARLLATLDAPPATLVERVRVARQRQIDDSRTLQRLRDDESLEIGRRTRALLGVIVTLLWTAAPLLGVVLPLSLPILVAGTTMFVAMLLIMGIWARESMTRTRLNRQLGGTIMLTFAAQFAVLYAGWRMDLSVLAIEQWMTLTWALGAAFATLVWPGFWPACLAFTVTFLGVIAYPQVRYMLMSAGNATLLLTVLWQNRVISLIKELQGAKRGGGGRPSV